VIGGSRARIQRNNRAAAFGCGNGQAPDATAEIQDSPVQVRQGGYLEWIQIEVAVMYLALKLLVEELDA
jgi:hypothetical protein